MKSHFFFGGGGGYGNVVLQQQWEDIIQKVYAFFMFIFQNSLIFFVDKIPHSQGTTPYLGISKI